MTHPCGAGPATDAEVPAFWHRLDLPGLIDIHVHFLPPRLLRRVWHYFDTAGPLLGRPWPIRYRGSDEERVAQLRELGVRAFTALAYAHRPGMAADLNAWTLDFAARTPGCLPTATFYPEPGVVGYTRSALAAGAQVFKVHLQVGNFDPADDALDDVWGLLADAGVPVVVHAGSGPVQASAHTGPEPFARVLTRHPRLTAVIAHLGAPECADFMALAWRYERVCLDTTMAFTRFFDAMAPFPAELLPSLRELGLAGKVLLGSDFPNIPHPYAEQLAGLAALDFGDDWLRAVCWHNALKISPWWASGDRIS